MTRAEATARVVAAARGMAHRFVREFSRDWPEVAAVGRALDALDACPPEEDVVGVPVWYGEERGEAVYVPRDLHDARALAWAAGEVLRLERDVRAAADPLAWICAYQRKWVDPHNGWWPTRDAEHAAWAGRYRAKVDPYTVHAGQEGYVPQAGPAPAQSVAPVPKPAGGSPERTTGAAQGDRINILLERFDALHDHSFANARRLDALAAQVGRRLDAVEQRTAQTQRALRAMLTRTDEYQLPISQETAWRNALAILNEGGPRCPVT